MHSPSANEPGFTMIELLTVLVIIAIMTAIAVPLIPALLNANTLDSSITNLTGILEQAREAAISGNTFIWIAFTDAPANSAVGTWVATIQSKDGTETGINTAVVPAWASAITVPGTAFPNLQLLSKIQNLPAVKIVDVSALPSTLTATAPANPSTLFESGATLASGSAQGTVSWNITSLQNTGLPTGTYFTRALEFTPTGEAHVPTVWNSNIQFGMLPSRGTTTTNAVLINVTRLTGKTTVYRQ